MIEAVLFDGGGTRSSYADVDLLGDVAGGSRRARAAVEPALATRAALDARLYTSDMTHMKPHPVVACW